MNSLKVGQELVLWYVSGEDARFRPDDQRKVAAVKELMVREAVGKISCGDLLSVRSVCANVFCKYQDLPGSYDNFNSFYRQVKRLIKV